MKSSYIVLIVIIAIIVLVVVRNRAVVKNEEREKRTGKWGRRSERPISSDKMKDIAGLDRILTYSAEESGKCFSEYTFRIDDITWNDLDLDSVYASSDTCVSSAGEEYLYHVLRTPALTEEKLSGRRGRIAFFRNHPETAVEDLLQLSDLGKCRGCSFAETILALEQADHVSVAGSVVQLAILILTILMIVFQIRFGLAAFVIVLIYNLVTYFRKRAAVGDPLISVNYLVCLIRVAGRAVKSLPGHANADSSSAELFQDIHSDILGSLNDLKGISGLGTLVTAGGMKGSFVDGLLDYVRMVTHLDLIAFELLRSRAVKNKTAVMRLLCALGEWESCIVLASWMESLPAFEKAEFSERTGILLADASHPLLEKAVPNSLSEETGILLTGSNASGKSTFLKTAALCVLFAQTTGFAPAVHYAAPFMRLYTSMALRDSIVRGESYYMTEIRSLKRIADAADRPGPPVICFIDEVLRGTNTVERIAASASLLRALADQGVLVFAATHDLELTRLMDPYLENMHFEEEMDAGDVHFTYRIHRGPARTRNAISLLQKIGFDPEITDIAAKMAENYERNGEWS